MGHAGPLQGLRIVELSGLGPVPYCGMMLADMGADVIVVERPASGGVGVDPRGPLERGRRSIALDLKQRRGLEVLLRLIDRSDAVFEGFRPGVAERLGFPPDVCLSRNPRLVYGRVTGWGREGPLAMTAGHDLNYLGVSGLLHAIGEAGGKPVPPLNVIGDFGGGGMLLAFGMLCALLSAARTGRGQVVDAAMLDGAASFLAPFMESANSWQFDPRPGRGLFAGAAPYYETYETSDGAFLSVAALEPTFYRALVERLGVDAERFLVAGFPATDAATTESAWPELKADLARLLRTRTREEWLRVFEGSDACVAPVLPLAEAVVHPHNVARGTFVTIDGVPQPAPAPRFGGTPTGTPASPPRRGAHGRAVLEELSFPAGEIEQLLAAGVVQLPSSLGNDASTSTSGREP